MQIPFFYISQYSPSDKITQLDEDTSRHVVQVLRMKKGDAADQLASPFLFSAHSRSATRVLGLSLRGLRPRTSSR